LSLPGSYPTLIAEDSSLTFSADLSLSRLDGPPILGASSSTFSIVTQSKIHDESRINEFFGTTSIEVSSTQVAPSDLLLVELLIARLLRNFLFWLPHRLGRDQCLSGLHLLCRMDGELGFLFT